MVQLDTFDGQDSVMLVGLWGNPGGALWVRSEIIDSQSHTKDLECGLGRHKEVRTGHAEAQAQAGWEMVPA